MLVEDEPIVRFYLKITLSSINGEVVDFKSAEDALKFLQDDPCFDLIITDINMGEMDGFSFIDEMAKQGLNIPIVVESAYLSDDERMINYRDKVKAFIKKPIDLNILELIIKRVEGEITPPH